jgi:hypothetical protein
MVRRCGANARIEFRRGPKCRCRIGANAQDAPRRQVRLSPLVDRDTPAAGPACATTNPCRARRRPAGFGSARAIQRSPPPAAHASSARDRCSGTAVLRRRIPGGARCAFRRRLGIRFGRRSVPARTRGRDGAAHRPRRPEHGQRAAIWRPVSQLSTASTSAAVHESAAADVTFVRPSSFRKLDRAAGICTPDEFGGPATT